MWAVQLKKPQSKGPDTACCTVVLNNTHGAVLLPLQVSVGTLPKLCLLSRAHEILSFPEGNMQSLHLMFHLHFICIHSVLFLSSTKTRWLLDPVYVHFLNLVAAV